MSTYHHGQTSDVTIFLEMLDPASRLPVTGKSPQIQIRRHRDSLTGVALDDYYWNGTTFVVTPTWLAMTEMDLTNSPGLYLYQFAQSLVGANMICLAYLRHTTYPAGFAVEEHIFGQASQTIAAEVWDELLAGHVISGSAGEALQAAAFGQVGARQIDILVEDAVASPIQGVQLDVYDAANTQFLGRFTTDILGTLSLALDDGTYSLRLWANGYSFTVPETLVVTADASVTYQGSLHVVTPPSSPNLCVIYGTLRDVAGNPHDAVCVEIYGVTPQVAGTVQLTERITSVFTDGAGYFELEVEREARVSIKTVEAYIDAIKDVPDAASQDLSTWADAVL